MTKKLYNEYWKAFIEYAFENDTFKECFKRRGPSNDHTFQFGIGYGNRILAGRNLKELSAVKIYINNDYFSCLYKDKDNIENKMGFKLDWEEHQDKVCSHVSIKKIFDDLSDKSKWNEQFEWFMNNMVKMYKVFKPYLP